VLFFALLFHVKQWRLAAYVMLPFHQGAVDGAVFLPPIPTLANTFAASS
jgi:hypothetical protein